MNKLILSFFFAFFIFGISITAYTHEKPNYNLPQCEHQSVQGLQQSHGFARATGMNTYRSGAISSLTLCEKQSFSFGSSGWHKVQTNSRMTFYESGAIKSAVIAERGHFTEQGNGLATYNAGTTVHLNQNGTVN